MYAGGHGNGDHEAPHAISDYGLMAGESLYNAQIVQAYPTAEREPVSALRSPIRRQHQHPQSQPKGRDNRRKSSGVKGDESMESSSSVRRRISRACDQCNQLRTKCDGGVPCAHCVGRYPAALSTSLG